MHRLRAPFAPILAGLVALGLAACSGAATPTNGRRIVIDVWLANYEFPHFLDPLRAQAARFGELHPEYQVNLQAFDYVTMPQRVTEAAANGTVPEIVQYYYSDTQLALDAVTRTGSPLFTSVEKAIGGRRDILGEPVVLGDIVPAVRDYYTFHGDTFAMPKNASTAVLYTNMDMLKEAEITEPPDTWGEIVEACEEIADIDHAPPSCITWANQGWFFQQAIAVQGGLLADNDNGRAARAQTVDLASREMFAWVLWWKGLSDEGHYLYTGLQEDFIGTTQAFLTGQTAFTINSSVPAGFFVDAARDAGFHIELSRFPVNDAVPYAGNVIGGDALWLQSGLDRRTQDGALAFMQFLNNPENSAAAAQVGGFIPLTESSINLVAAQGVYDQRPYLRVAIDQLSDPRRFSPGTEAVTSPAAQGALLGDFTGIERHMTQAMEDVLVRGADPIGRFSQASADAQMLLNEYNASVHRGPNAR